MRYVVTEISNNNNNGSPSWHVFLPRDQGIYYNSNCRCVLFWSMATESYWTCHQLFPITLSSLEHKRYFERCLCGFMFSYKDFVCVLLKKESWNVWNDIRVMTIFFIWDDKYTRWIWMKLCILHRKLARSVILNSSCLPVNHALLSVLNQLLNISKSLKSTPFCLRHVLQIRLVFVFQL